MAISSNYVSLFRSSDPYEILISQMIEIERQPQYALQDERKNQDRLKKVMSDADSKISALHKLVKEFRDLFNSPFRGRGASVPQNASFSVSASDKAAYGAHTLDVQRLASADTRVSKQYTAGGNTLSSVFSGGPQTFTIQIAKPTADDPDHLEDISVTVDPQGTTDAEILKEISQAINQAMDEAVNAGTISNADRAIASVVNETSDTARLSLRSGKTGYENRLRFVDSDGGLLAALEVDRTTLHTGTGGGATVEVGTSEIDSALNSKFVLDGLTLYRSTNKVTDALDGLTLDLKKAGEGPYEFSIAADAEGIKNKVNDFIKKYNDLLIYIGAKSEVDADAGIRGDFAGDAAFRSLRYNMRNAVSQAVSGQNADAPKALTDLGIEIAKDGTLTLKDEKKLLDAVTKDASAVERLFAHDDGIATRLLDQLGQFVGTSGIINSRKKSIDTRLKRLDDRIKSWDAQLLQRESQLRSQYAKMQEVIASLQGQHQSLSSILGYY